MELNEQLILLPTNELLEKFGAGNHVPGSGSAVALSAILACKLCFTVIRLSNGRPGYEGVIGKLEFIEKRLSELEPKLYQAFQEDSEVFNKVVEIRREKPDGEQAKRRNSEAELQQLRIATQIQLDLCTTCLEIGENAVHLFDIAFQSARGDSGAAASNAVSAAYAALFICYLNLKKFREGQWAVDARKKCQELLEMTGQLQKELFSRVLTLRAEGSQLESDQLELDLEFESLDE